MWFAAGFLGGLLVGVLGAVLAILVWAVPRFENLVLFRPAKDVLRKPSDWGVPFDQCFIDTPDGCRLAAWHLCPESPVASVIYFHGSTGCLGWLAEMLVMFYRHGLQVFAVDYRGYGWSTGKPSEQGLHVDASATIAYFDANFKRAASPIVYWGRSLGSFVAAHAAAQVPPSGLILETAFINKAALMEEYPQYRFFQPFARCRLETAAPLKGHDFPILILHGDKDKTVPLRQGQNLYTQLNEPKEFWRVDGAGHVDIHMVDSASYMRKILDFAARLRPMRVH